MVYSKKCVNCGKMIDFGGVDDGELPETAIEFDGKIYCRDCVKEFGQFGVGEMDDRVAQLEEHMKEIREELGFEKGP